MEIRMLVELLLFHREEGKLLKCRDFVFLLQAWQALSEILPATFTLETRWNFTIFDPRCFQPWKGVGTI